MIDHKNLLRFLTKEQVQISVEEFLFLYTVRFYTEKTVANWQELDLYIKTYYLQNTFYGQKEFPGEKVKMNYNLMVEKLEKQGYLVDYRTNKSKLSFDKFKISPEFSDMIWTDRKDEEWQSLQDFIEAECGSLTFTLPNGTSIGYFAVNQKDYTINSMERLKNYYWDNICQGGNKFAIGEFRANLLAYIEYNDGLKWKMSNFFINYHEGTLKQEIESQRAKRDDDSSIYKRL